MSWNHTDKSMRHKSTREEMTATYKEHQSKNKVTDVKRQIKASQK